MTREGVAILFALILATAGGYGLHGLSGALLALGASMLYVVVQLLKD